MSRPVSSLQIPPSVRQKLIAAGFTVVGNLQDVGPVELAKEAEISHDEALRTLELLCTRELASQRSVTAIDMIRKV